MLEMFAHRSMEMIHQYVAKGFVYFDDSEKSFYKANLTEIIESAVRGLNDAYGIHQIKVTVPEKSLHISSCGHLHTVFTILRCFEAKETMEIRAEIDNAESAVLIQIQMPPQKHLRDYPGSDVDLARNILKKHNSKLEIQERNEKTIFHFPLPLWLDE